MSYDISLYDAGFLRSAIASGQGDWTTAPPLGGEIRMAIIRAAEAEGFVETPHPPGFVEFMRAQGVAPSVDFHLAKPQLDIVLQIFENSAALMVRAAATANSSIAFGRQFGQHLSKELQLGFHDPQLGEVSYGEA